MNKKIPLVNRRYIGISINSGNVTGEVCKYSSQRHRFISQFSLSTDQAIKEELEKFEEVIVLCSHELNRIASDVAKKIGKAEAEIFLTQKHIMNDPKIVSAIRGAVVNGRKNLEWAISEILNSYEEKFSNIDNQYLRERSSDISEIRNRLLNRLTDKKNGFVCHGHESCTKGKYRVIIAEELTPEMVVKMDLDNVLGIVTEKGGMTSHAAIIARSIGIPAVSGVIDILDNAKCGDSILIDGDNGLVFLNPDDQIKSQYVSDEQEPADLVCALKTPEGLEVMANASSVEDVMLAGKVKADGVGLFRTEIMFIKDRHLLSESEQYLYYRKVYDAMEGKPVTFRLLDAGGDKQLPFLKYEQEQNPFLGWRGARFLLGNPEILTTQLTALVRLSTLGKVRIMFPMVVDSIQSEQLIKFTREIVGKCESVPENLSLGAMFEIPSAFLEAKKILSLFDFGSIGSNDLIQYLFAIDRGNALVAGEYNPDHPALWTLLKDLAQNAAALNKPLSLCGEMAAREGMSSRLVDIKIKSVSVAPRLIPRVRNELAHHAGQL
ncbi:Phosphoenolpyruvate-protein phosphotransferase of PTS system [Chitinispirillum alkaliphilum]|nr:Phosphoenolpyruvate-protein phosphotransferase of PTS system [Chitinispirillum alkaliphilum]